MRNRQDSQTYERPQHGELGNQFALLSAFEVFVIFFQPRKPDYPELAKTETKSARLTIVFVQSIFIFSQSANRIGMLRQAIRWRLLELFRNLRHRLGRLHEQIQSRRRKDRGALRKPLRNPRRGID
jgi:hypothetical protein